MKKIQKHFLLLLFIVGAIGQICAQDIYDKLSRKLCKCVEKEQVKDPSGMGYCFEKLLVNNLEELKDYYNAQTMSDLNMEEIGNKIGAKMIKECDYVIDNFPTGMVGSQEPVTKQQNLNCEDLKNGDFYYLNKRPQTGVIDTTFVTISNNMFLERMKNGRTYSLLNIKWKEDCKFSLEFKESNDPMKKEVSSPGDIYEYEILTNGEKSFFLNVFWRERTHQFELFKLK